jgi:hypothetical protein
LSDILGAMRIATQSAHCGGIHAWQIAPHHLGKCILILFRGIAAK